MYCRKFNAEFNNFKLIKTVGRRARFLENDVQYTHFAKNFDFIWIFSYSHLISP